TLHGCPNLKVRLVQGEADAEILKAAREEKADVIVMTSRGRSLDKEPGEATGLGTVARQVLEKSVVPVQIVYP
ncbi:MAG: universal stress protein, partial [Acidobacteriota bacterium]